MDGFIFSTNEFRDPEEALAQNINRIHGKVLADWLSAQLQKRGIDVSETFAEDFGWGFYISANGADYFCACSLDAGEDAPADVWDAEGHVSLDKKRSLMDKLRGRNKFTDDDPVGRAIFDVLSAHSGVRDLKIDR